MEAYVYITINLINQRMYIGAHRSRIYDEDYLGSGTAIKNALNKYGKENFKNYMIKSFEDDEEAFEYEAYLIDKFNAVKDPRFYNLIKGGLGSWNHCTLIIKGSVGIRNPVTGKQKRVRPEDVDSYLNRGEGWELGFFSPKGSQVGKRRRIIVAKEELVMYIYPEDLSYYEKQGFTHIPYKSNNGLIWVNDGQHNELICNEDLGEYMDHGFVKGCLQAPHKAFSIKGKTAMKSPEGPYIFVSDNEIEYYLSIGYSLGKGFSSTKDRIWIHNENSELMIDPDELEEYESRGYKKGKLGFPVQMTNDDEVVTVKAKEVNEYLKLGYKIIGCSCQSKIAGRIKMNNGERTIFVDPSEEENWKSKGFVR